MSRPPVDNSVRRIAILQTYGSAGQKLRIRLAAKSAVARGAAKNLSDWGLKTLLNAAEKEMPDEQA